MTLYSVGFLCVYRRKGLREGGQGEGEGGGGGGGGQTRKKKKKRQSVSSFSSFLRNYLVVKYKDRPLEFWDVRSQTFLRELVSNPPTFSCIEWSPSPKTSKSQKVDHTAFGVSMSTVDFDVAMGTSDHKPTQVNY